MKFPCYISSIAPPHIRRIQGGKIYKFSPLFPSYIYEGVVGGETRGKTLLILSLFFLLGEILVLTPPHPHKWERIEGGRLILSRGVVRNIMRFKKGKGGEGGET